MAKQNLNNLVATVAALEDYYAGLSSPGTATWSKSMTLGYIAVAGVQNTSLGTDHIAQIAAAIMTVLPVSQQQEITNGYVIPGTVQDYITSMNGTAAWPAPLARVAWSAPTAQDLATYQAALTSQLTEQMNALAAPVIQASARQVMVQNHRELQACRIKYNWDNATPTAADFPAIESYRIKMGLADLSAAADAIIARGLALATANKSMQDISDAAATNIAAAADMPSAKAVFDQAVADMQAVIVALPAA